MKKRWAYGLLLAVTLAGAVACRVWQRGSAWEEGGLLTPGHPSTYCLLALSAVAAVGFLLLGRWTAKGGSFESYLAAFSLPGKGLLAVYVLAGALMVAGGVVGLTQWAQGAELTVSEKAMSLALLPGGAGAALVGWVNGQQEEARGRFAWPLLLPAYAGCLWLIAVYQARATEPNVMGYAFTFLGALCAVIFCYAASAFSFEKPMPALTVWLSGVALTALGVSLVDDLECGDTVQSLVTLGYMLYLAVQTACLLTRADRPAQLERWTPPEEPEAAEDETKTEETREEVEEHEQ